MLIKATKVIGLPVYTIQKGKDIEKVKDVIYDLKSGKVEALLVDKGGWFSAAKVIPMSEVKSIGDDAVMVESDRVVKTAPEAGGKIEEILSRDKRLTKTKVVTEDGTNLGEVADILFDPNTGVVEEVEISQGAIKNIGSGTKTIKVSNIITLGKETSIVKNEALREIELQSDQKGLKGAANAGREKVVDKYEEIKDSPKTQQLLDQTRQSSENIRQQYRQTKNSAQTQNVVDAIKMQGIKLGEAAKRESSKLKGKINQEAKEFRTRKHKKI